MTVQELRERGAGVGNHAPHDPIQLRAAAVVCRVRHDLEALSRIPSRETELSAADSFARDVRCAKLLRRNVFVYVLRNDVNLVDEIVKRFRPLLLVPHDSR